MAEKGIEALGQLVRLGDDLPRDQILAKLAANYAVHDWPDDSLSYTFISARHHQDQEPPDTEFLLYQLERLDMTLSLELRPSAVPLLGPVIDRGKRMLHQLVLFYVNQVAARVATTNMIQARLLRAAYERQISRDALPLDSEEDA